MDSLESDLEPVTLAYWPTCKDALTWSNEDLAVAAGEVVHILTPRNPSKLQEVPGHKQWHTFTLRANQFTPSEWPLQDMATVRLLSLGEELSESTVVSIAWSPPGLGLHRRSVLAVLTSSLILSFWETNGTLGVWQRTAIVNQHLPIDSSGDHVGVSRRRGRVRAFQWLPSLFPSAEAKWGRQLLAVADDDYTISVFHVRKTNDAAYGQWSFELLAQHQITELQQARANALSKHSSLRIILSQSSPISKLEATEWETEEESNRHAGTENLVVKVSFGQCCDPSYLVVQVRRADADSAKDGYDLELLLRLSKTPLDLALSAPPAEEIFESAIQKPRSELNKNYGLAGKVRVRYWGTVLSPGHATAAACVSLHPSDMIEHGIPSNQRITLVFARMQETSITENVAEDPSKVLERILEFVKSSPERLVKTDLDEKIAHNAAAMIKAKFSTSTPLVSWADSWFNRNLTAVPGQNFAREVRGREAILENDQKDVDDTELGKRMLELEKPASSATHPFRSHQT